jgi:hypothetical protein
VAFEVQMECTQTQVKEQGEIGYRSGERLPVGHKDVDGTWRPVVVDVEDAPEPEHVPASKKETPAASAAASSPVKPAVK